MGCLGRLGCLLVLAVLGVAAYLTRDSWLPKVWSRAGSGAGAADVAAAPTWQPLTPDGAQRARRALDRLNSPRGAAYADLLPGDLASYIYEELAKSLPSSADSVQAAAIGDRLYVRALVRTADLGSQADLGPLAYLLGERERVQLGGEIDILRPGLAELRVREFRIRDLSLPQPLIPKLIQHMSRGDRLPELSPDGIALHTPAFIGDVRVRNGKITLYRAVPESAAASSSR